ncbi:hypothetical protein F2Q68_00012809 [Brassica cretica]|uniref:Uncharacterized protein n=1 Tax=Brassica cretica TaxID=69181 RepID=A0A8S9HCJ8_BRACR|nr:hypothetical protein F2Q68_00012809 [Brassica cretica]
MMRVLRFFCVSDQLIRCLPLESDGSLNTVFAGFPGSGEPFHCLRQLTTGVLLVPFDPAF